jgi:hypothetical protein
MNGFKKTVAALAIVALLASGCAGASDDDGDLFVEGRLAPAAAKDPDAVPVVVDSDLAPDDLVALAYLLRHPRVRVLAVTVPTTGIVTCPAGVDLVGDLVRAVRADPVPVSCGRTPRGAHGVAFPSLWTIGALTDSRLERDLAGTGRPSPQPADRTLATLAREHDDLVVVALGPMTELAATLRDDPASYARIDRVVAMTGIVKGASQGDGIGEWNAAADPDALAEVLDGPVPLTVVPHEVVPLGPPAGKSAPVVGQIGVLSSMPSPRFWDLATSALFTVPEAGKGVRGTWSVDLDDDLGRLSRTGEGDDTVVTSLDTDRLDAAYAEVFIAE